MAIKQIGNVATAVLLTAMRAPQTLDLQKNTRNTCLNEAKAWFPEFDTFGEKSLSNALIEAHRFTTEFKSKEPGRCLSLLGKTDNGKTMLADWIREKTAEKRRTITNESGYESIVFSVRSPRFYWPDVAKELLNGCWNVGEAIIAPELVFIDDIGAEYDPKKSIASELSRICERRKNKWTVFTSNLLLHQIAELIDTRVASRMQRPHGRSVIVELNAQPFGLRER